ncbi:MAG: hypothetical protein ACFFD2_24595, partial [Promethearchaeota archaeon]
MLNVTFIVVEFFCASIASLIVTTICFWTALRKKFIPLYLFGVFFLSLSLASLFEAFADLYLNISIRFLSGLCYGSSPLLFVLFLNYVRKESIISIHLSVWSAISAVFLFLEFQPANHSILSWQGVLSLSRAPLLSVFLNSVIIILLFYYLYWSILTLVKAPKNLKKHAWLLVITFPTALAVFSITALFIYQA